jgi:hypothetical protein
MPRSRLNVTDRQRREEDMINIKTIAGLIAVAVAVVGIVVFGAARAAASSASIVIPYQKTCVAGHCEGTLNGVTIEMQVTGFRQTSEAGAAQLTVTEDITVENMTLGSFRFTAKLNGHVSPAGFIVLNGTVTEDSDFFAGAKVHQRSNLVSGGGTSTEEWAGQLQLMPESA